MGMLHRRHHSLEACGELDQRRQEQIQNQIHVITRLQTAIREQDHALERVRRVMDNLDDCPLRDDVLKATVLDSTKTRTDALDSVAALVLRMKSHAESETTRAQYIASAPTGEADVIERSVAENVSRVLSKYVNLFSQALALVDPAPLISQEAVKTDPGPTAGCPFCPEHDAFHSHSGRTRDPLSNMTPVEVTPVDRESSIISGKNV